MTSDQLLVYASSLAIGLLLGFERERSHRNGVHQAAGSRTFALLSLSGTLAASLDRWVIAAALLAVGAMLALGYRRTSVADPGATTEVAALATFLLGAVAWEHTGLAAAIAIVVLVLLSAKARLHAFARDVVTDVEVDDAIKFLVMAFVVLPLLPDRDVGPYGVVNPERIWQLVVALTGISWAGYIATRVLGPRRGLLIAGLAGGFISASATTAGMARLSRTPDRFSGALVGAYLASLATFGQLAAILAVADRPLLQRMWPALLAGGVTVVMAAAIGARIGAHRAPGGSHSLEQPPFATSGGDASDSVERPFGLRPALVLAGVLMAALLLGRWVVDVIGPNATMVAAGAAGLADAHAGALAAATLHEQGDITMRAALLAVGASLSVNTVVKCVLALTAGGRAFATRFAAGIVPAFAVFMVGLVVLAA